MDVLVDENLFAPHSENQRLFLDDYTHRYLAAAGGWRGGKTWIGARKLVMLHMINGGVMAGHATGVDSLAVAQTYQAALTVIIPELRKALTEAGIRFQFHGGSAFWFDLPDLAAGSDRSLIYVRTAERPEVIAGFEVGAVWGDEVARWRTDPDDPLKDPVLQSGARLADWRAVCQQFLMTFTHEGDSTSVFNDFELTPKPNHKLYRLPTIENPLMKSYVAQQKMQLTPALAKQYLEGFAASFKGGNVYDNYSRTRNVDETNSIGFDQTRPLQMAMDFNIDPGMHVELGQHYERTADRCDRCTVIDEIFEPRMDVKSFVNRFRRYKMEVLDRLPRVNDTDWRFPGKLELFGDASGNNPNLATGESCWEVLIGGLASLGVPFTIDNVPAGNPHVADRVMAVNCAFMNMAGEVRYVANARCERLITDWNVLKWQGNEIDKRDRKKSHPSDADGYRIYQLMPIRKLEAVIGGQVGSA